MLPSPSACATTASTSRIRSSRRRWPGRGSAAPAARLADVPGGPEACQSILTMRPLFVAARRPGAAAQVRRSDGGGQQARPHVEPAVRRRRIGRRRWCASSGSLPRCRGGGGASSRRPSQPMAAPRRARADADRATATVATDADDRGDARRHPRLRGRTRGHRQPRRDADPASRGGRILDRGERLYELDGKLRPVLLYGAGRPGGRSTRTRPTAPTSSSSSRTSRRSATPARATTSTATGTPTRPRRQALAEGRRAAARRARRARRGRVPAGPSASPTGRSTLGRASGRARPCFRAPSDERVVTVDLAADRADLVAEGDAVDVALPDGSTTTGTIETRDRGRGRRRSSPAQPVDPDRRGHDQPRRPEGVGGLRIGAGRRAVVRETRGRRPRRAGRRAGRAARGRLRGRRVDADGTTRLVGVEPGIFQDGWVEVRGTGLAAGDTVVVPS